MSYDTLSTNAPDIHTLNKFPHTRAQLAALARQYKPLESDSGSLDHVEQRLVNQVVSLLTDEREDELKELLQQVYGLDDESVEHGVLELMHKHRDDVAGVPFLFLTPTRRPISRPSSRASSTSRLRPDTPISAPTSPLANLFRKPTMSEHSPSSSPVLSHSAIPSSAFVAQSQFTASLPASPLSSPRLLNAKANEFRPIPRPLSAAATHPHYPHTTSSSLLGLRADTPSPDMWAHNSPRATSNLAIAAPLIADQISSAHGTTPLRSSHRPKDLDDDEDDPFDPFASNNNNGGSKTNPLPSFHSITISDFDTNSWTGGESAGDGQGQQQQQQPFPLSFYPSDSDLEFPNNANYFDDFDVNDDPTAMYANNNGGNFGNTNYNSMNSLSSSAGATADDETSAALTDGMTPFDVLTSIFGSTLAPSELEDALAANGFDFERAMAWLVDRALPSSSGAGIPSQQQQQQQTQPGQQPPGGLPGRLQPQPRVTLVGRGAPAGRGMPNQMMMMGRQQQQLQGIQQQQQQQQQPGRYVNGRAAPNGNRVCRYFVAGECLRADCRFSHDLERALCRFWLRGTCAKQESCEFLHHLPKDVDMASLNAVLARANVQPGTGPLAGHMVAFANAGGMGGQQQQASDEFPALGYENGVGGPNGMGRGGGGVGPGGLMGGVTAKKYAAYVNDPSRTRFAAAVKKPAPAPHGMDENGGGTSTNGVNINGNGTSTNANGTAAARSVLGAAADNLYHPTAIIAPRPSPRLKLRPPLLLPTIPTGGSLSAMYMSYRNRALQLGATRNACLSRAADAWRRGDGAGAKRFSKEGQAMNERMKDEMRDAAAGLVRERVKVAEGAVRGRDAGWSDDPGDRGVRGRVVGAGLGVCLGVVGRNQLASLPGGTGSGVAGSAGTGGGTTASGGIELTQDERTEAMLDLHGLHSNEATEVLEKFLLGLEQEHFYGLAYVIVGEEKHTGSQDLQRGAAPARGGRLAMAVKEWLHRWGYPWSERDGVVCVDALTHLSA